MVLAKEWSILITNMLEVVRVMEARPCCPEGHGTHALTNAQTHTKKQIQVDISQKMDTKTTSKCLETKRAIPGKHDVVIIDAQPWVKQLGI